MGFSVDIDDLEKQYKALLKMDKNFNSFLEDFLLEQAERLIARTKRRTPVDTGELRRSWILGNVYGRGSSIEVEILNGMEYASDVEYGHIIKDVNGNEIGFKDGVFMLKMSIDSIRKLIPNKWQEQFRNYCNMKGFMHD